MLDEGVRSVTGGTVAWHVEVDEAASKCLAHNYPHIPNHGDITKVDWSTVEAVDILTGGFPCQDVSAAGKRAGLAEGTRSGLWSEFHAAIDSLRPGLVVIENVRGLLSARTDQSRIVETFGPKGGRKVGHTERALGRVLADLADIGYDAQWLGVRASDAGAPHQRFRVFVVAHPQDANLAASRERRLAASGEAPGGWARPHSGGSSGVGAAPDADHHPEGHGRQLGHSSRRSGESAQRDHVTPSDAEGKRRGMGNAANVGPTSREGHASVDEDLDPASDADHQGSQGGESARGCDMLAWGASSDADSVGRQQYIEHDPVRCRGTDISWGAYEPAVRRWEGALGRPAPSPTELSPRGGQRLSPRLTEWMMGWPEGWVTDVPGLSRNDQLKICGNGVVPQQAALAIRHLLSWAERAA